MFYVYLALGDKFLVKASDIRTDNYSWESVALTTKPTHQLFIYSLVSIISLTNTKYSTMENEKSQSILDRYSC